MAEFVDVQISLRNHPKMLRLSRMLNCRTVYLMGHLTALWQWVLQYAPNGDISQFDAVDIAIAADWQEDPDLFIDSLLHCGSQGKHGFLETTPSGALVVHDWHRWSGRFCKKPKHGHKHRFVNRFAIANRDDWKCGICGGDIQRRDLHIDHIIPVCRGGSSDPSNLQAAHAACNWQKGGR